MKKIFITFLLAFTLLPTLAFAQDGKTKVLKGLDKTREAAGLTETAKDGSDLPEIIGLIVNGLFGVIGVIFMLWMLIGAYTWLTSGGNEEKVVEAKKKIIAAINGMIVTFLAYALTFLIVRALTGALGG